MRDIDNHQLETNDVSTRETLLQCNPSCKYKSLLRISHYNFRLAPPLSIYIIFFFFSLPVPIMLLQAKRHIDASFPEHSGFVPNVCR